MKYRFLLDYVIYEKQGRPEMKEIRFEKGEVVELDIDTVYAREDKDIAIVLVRKGANIVLVPIIVMMFAAERVDEITNV